MANEPESHASTMSITALIREQLTIMQESFINALAQQRATLET